MIVKPSILFGFLIVSALFVPIACVLGSEEEPGCHNDAECDDGFVCRSGACFRITTDLSPPRDPAMNDAGDAGDTGLSEHD